MGNGTVPTEFEHQRRRKVAIKCLELEGMLESQGFSKQDINNRVASFRTLLLRQPYNPSIRENNNGSDLSNSVLKNDVYAINPKLQLRTSPDSHSRKKKKKRKDHHHRRRSSRRSRSRSKSRRKKKKRKRSRSRSRSRTRTRSRSRSRSRSYDKRYAKDDHKLDEPLSVKIDDCNILDVDQPSTSSGIGPSPIEDCLSPAKQVNILCKNLLEICDSQSNLLVVDAIKNHIPSIFIYIIYPFSLLLF